MLRFAFVLLSLSAEKPDPKLVATWLLGGEPFLTLNANGSGVMEDGRVKWSVEGTQLVIADEEGGVDRVSYSIQGDTLTLSMGGAPLQLTRAGKGVTVQKAGKLSKAMERGSDADAEAKALAAAQRYLQQQGATPVGKPGTPRGPPAAPARGSAGNDQLSQLLMSSAWCWLKYASGNTYTERIVFSANGTWSSNKESEIDGRNDYAGTTGHAVGVGGAGGQWAVKGGQFSMSEPPESPQLVPVSLQVTRNSNGYPIITADGKEYSQCN